MMQIISPANCTWRDAAADRTALELDGLPLALAIRPVLTNPAKQHLATGIMPNAVRLVVFSSPDHYDAGLFTKTADWLNAIQKLRWSASCSGLRQREFRLTPESIQMLYEHVITGSKLWRHVFGNMYDDERAKFPPVSELLPHCGHIVI